MQSSWRAEEDDINCDLSSVNYRSLGGPQVKPIPNSGTGVRATDGLGHHPMVDMNLESEADDGENYFSEQPPPINATSPDPKHRYASQKGDE